MSSINELKLQKDRAYRERNQLVAFLSHLVPAWIQLHDENDKEWDPAWRYIIYMTIPVSELTVFGDRINQINDLAERHEVHDMQLSWHIHESEIPLFDHLEIIPNYSGTKWDGHTTEEKYKRMRNADFRALGKLIKDVTNERAGK